MLKHIVLWKFKAWAAGRSKAENLHEAREALGSLEAVIPAIRCMEVGINGIPSDSSYDLALIVEVDDRAALEQYLRHPRHQEVSECMTLWRETRVCVDMFC